MTHSRIFECFIQPLITFCCRQELTVRSKKKIQTLDSTKEK